MFQPKSPNGLGWHSRGYLPHFDDGVSPQFVTARLADSMPQDVLHQWAAENERGEIDNADLRRRIEGYLDRGCGSCHLRVPEVALMVCETLHNGDGVDYELHSYVVMPNHLHVLFTQIEPRRLEDVVQSIKSVTAHKANKLLGRSGRFWFPEAFDRVIRTRRHFGNTRRYIENNPVKAGLCAKPADWPFTSAGKTLTPPFWELEG